MQIRIRKMMQCDRTRSKVKSCHQLSLKVAGDVVNFFLYKENRVEFAIVCNIAFDSEKYIQSAFSQIIKSCGKVRKTH